MTTTATSGLRLAGMAPGPHAPHMLHSSDRLYPETNCYTDVVIELLHARGDEPRAVLASTLAADFEGDQWTFFKPAEEDLRDLFGVSIHEQQPYRDGPTQIAEQLRAGRTLLMEADGWFLPDTRGLSYRVAHVKTAIIVAGIDPEAGELTYFHNGGCHELSGTDYAGVMRIGITAAEALPLYSELVRFDAGPRLAGAALRAAARDRLGASVQRRPATNPFVRMGAWLDGLWPAIDAGLEPPVHDRIFATARMAGAAAELGAAHVDWLLGPEGARPTAALLEIAGGCKILAVRLARMRPFDAGACVAPMAAHWDEAMDALARLA